VGAVFINPEVYYDIAQFLNADDFYIHRNRWIWESFTSLHEQRIPIDLLTVSDELERRGQLGDIGGPAYLTSLVNQVPSSLNAESYGRIVESYSIRRKMIHAANQIASIAYNERTSVDDVMDEAEKAVFNVSERRLKHDLKPISSVLSDYYDRIDDLAKRPDDIVGVPTGFLDLDKLLTGLQPSDLLIIAGRPGQGKTGFLLSIAKNAGNVQRAGRAALDRPGDRYRLAAPAHRSLTGHGMAAVHARYRSVWRYTHLSGRYSRHYPTSTANKMSPFAHGVWTRPDHYRLPAVDGWGYPQR
jgi:replicative DNA helicase